MKTFSFSFYFAALGLATGGLGACDASYYSLQSAAPARTGTALAAAVPAPAPSVVPPAAAPPVGQSAAVPPAHETPLVLGPAVQPPAGTRPAAAPAPRTTRPGAAVNAGHLAGFDD